MAIVGFQFVAVFGLERRPVEAGGDYRFPIERWPGLLIRHFQKQEIGELLHVVAVREPVVAKDIAIRPELANEGLRVAHSRDPGTPDNTSNQNRDLCSIVSA